MRIKTLLLIITGLFSCAALAVGNPQAGQQKAQVCATCHGADGNSLIGTYPKLAGQYASYLETALKQYRQGANGPRNNPIMAMQAQNLSDQDIEDLAAYFSSQKPVYGDADAKLVELGRQIYRGGNLKTGVPACAACHGPDGQGNKDANYPKLAGQQSQYVIDQMAVFKQRARPGPAMYDIADKISDEELKAVASYINGLSPNPTEPAKK